MILCMGTIAYLQDVVTFSDKWQLRNAITDEEINYILLHLKDILDRGLNEQMYVYNYEKEKYVMYSLRDNYEEFAKRIIGFEIENGFSPKTSDVISQLAELMVIVTPISNESTEFIAANEIDDLFRCINFIKGNWGVTRHESVEILFGRISGGNLRNQEFETIFLYDYFTNMVLLSDSHSSSKDNLHSFIDNLLEFEVLQADIDPKLIFFKHQISTLQKNHVSNLDIITLVSIMEMFLVRKVNGREFNVDESINRQLRLKTLVVLDKAVEHLPYEYYEQLLREIYSIRSNIAHGNTIELAVSNKTKSIAKKINPLLIDNYEENNSTYNLDVFLDELRYIVVEILKLYVREKPFIDMLKRN